MRLSTGSRIKIDGVNGTVIVTDSKGNVCMAKFDNEERIFEIKKMKVEPIIVE